MAKRVNTPEEKNQEPIQDNITVKQEQDNSSDKPDTIQTLRKETPGVREIPPHIEETLKLYRGYETLYIDAHGGAYSPDTPESIRGNAILYQNPFFNQNHLK